MCPIKALVLFLSFLVIISDNVLPCPLLLFGAKVLAAKAKAHCLQSVVSQQGDFRERTQANASAFCTLIVHFQKTQIFGQRVSLYSRNQHKRTYFYKNLEAEIQYFKPQNKNMSEAETGEGSYITGFMSSEFMRTLKNS